MKSITIILLILLPVITFSSNTTTYLKQNYWFCSEKIEKTREIKKLNNSASSHISTYPKLSYNIAKSAFSLSNEISYNKGKVESLYNMANAQFNLGNYNQSKILFEYTYAGSKLLDLIEYKAKSLKGIARINLLKNEYKLCLQNSLTSLKFFRKVKNLEYIADIYSIIGVVFAKNNEFDKALIFNDKAYNIYSFIKNDNRRAYILNNNAIIYAQQNKLDKALVNFNKAKLINLNNNSFEQLALNYLNIGKIHSINQNSYEAEKYFYKSLEINNKYTFLIGKGLSHFNLGMLFYEQNNYTKAKYHLVIAKNLTHQNLQADELKKTIETLASIYESEKNYKEALFYYKKQIALIDSISKTQAGFDLQKLEQIYQSQINKNLLEIKNRDNEILKMRIYKVAFYRTLFLSILIALSIVLIFFHFHLKNRKKTNKKLLELNKTLQIYNDSLRQKEFELSELNKTKDKFFSLISHDLRNPFASLVSFVRLMKRDFAKLSKTEVMELIEELEKTTNSAHDLLENLLLWSRTQTSNIKYSPLVFDLNEVLSKLESLYSNQLISKNLNLHIESVKPFTIYADKNMMFIILSNLIQNAIKFSKNNNKIDVSTASSDEYYCISVTDYGVGMSSKTKEQLFKPGTSYTMVGTREEKGSGIGLLICKEFVNYHKGKIEVESAEGKGTTLKVFIPKLKI